MKTTDFPSMLSDFLLKELPNIRNQSSNTIISYRDTYVRLLIYCRDVLSIKPERISVADLTAERLVDYLNWLEQDCNNSINTRNQRLAAIHSLFRYIQMQSPEYLFQCQQILGIPYKKAEKHPVGYLSEDETKTLLSTPDTSTRKGRRDQTLLTLLYDSGARVQELVDLRVGDLRLDPPSQVKLTGKGKKTRSVPLMDKTVALLRQYLMENKLDSPVSFEHPLFFNSQRKKLTRQGIAYILDQATGISNMQPRDNHGTWYDLTGRSVTLPRRGIYIRNGRKYAF
jgi:site-specific recombinase XerD